MPINSIFSLHFASARPGPSVVSQRRARPGGGEASTLNGLQWIEGCSCRPFVPWHISVVDGCLLVGGNIRRGRPVPFAIRPAVEIRCKYDDSGTQ